VSEHACVDVGSAFIDIGPILIDLIGCKTVFEGVERKMFCSTITRSGEINEGRHFVIYGNKNVEKIHMGCFCARLVWTNCQG
jgi:hypothetical protein